MHRLPDELILQIIAYLEPPELVNLQHVSRQFLNLSRDNNLWRTLCFDHSAAERRRRRLLPASDDIDPRLAELVRAANEVANSYHPTNIHDLGAPGAEAQVQKNVGKRRAALLSNWDPTYPGEKVDFYQEFIQRHAPHEISWFQEARQERGDKDEGLYHEATGAGILYHEDGLAEKLVAPLEDGGIAIWSIGKRAERQGGIVGRSPVGVLTGKGSDLDHDTRMSQSQAMMTETGAVECVSVDSRAKKGFFAVQNTLNEVDLRTLQVVSRTPYPFPITALSEAWHPTPLTVGTNWTIHLHDTRRQPSFPTPSTTTCELIGGPTSSFSRLATGDFGGHVSLAQPGALSILHLPTTREWDGNGDIWVAGRFTSLLNFDRRVFPRLRGTVHSGARLSCLTSIPHPFVPHELRVSPYPHLNSSRIAEAKAGQGHTLIAAGEYKGKGSLELYGLSSEPSRSINSSDAWTARNSHACYQNRQTASGSKLLSVAPHGTSMVFADGDGGMKWVERDGSTLVRSFNINPFNPSAPSTQQTSALGEQENNDTLVQKILPTSLPGSSPSLHKDNLVIWTGDGRLAQVSFGGGGWEEDVFYDAQEEMEIEARKREREFSMDMRRALEYQGRELRWLRGYGL